MVLQVIIPPIPAELIVIGAGKLYGTLLTTIIAGTGLYIGSIIVFFIGRYLEKRFNKFFNKKKLKLAIDRLRQFESLILWLRILPYNPSDIISYAAGIIKVRTKKFLLISFFTSYIRTFALAYLGTKIQSVSSTLAILSLLLISAIIGYGFLYKKI